MCWVGIFEEKRWLRLMLLPVATFFCSAAKPQYFYFAALAAIVLAGFEFAAKRKVDVALTGILFLASGVSYLYAYNFPGKSANYYNSTYFGSYLLLADDQLRQLGVKDSDFECIGVDPWGNRIQRDNSLKLSQGVAGCTQRIPISLDTVLTPYLKHPSLLIRLWQYAAPAHFTVRYFHVYLASSDIIPSDGKSFHEGRALIEASNLRERWITPNYLLIIALGLLIPFIPHNLINRKLKAATFLLALFIVSQFAVGLLGEGVRDLSKHVAAAQLCLNFLSALLIVQLGVYAVHFGRTFVHKNLPQVQPKPKAAISVPALTSLPE